MPASQCGRVLSLWQERHDHEVAGLERPDLGPDLLDDADHLVADRVAGGDVVLAAVKPQVRPADAAATTFTIASVGLSMLGMGRSSSRMSLMPWIVVTRMPGILPRVTSSVLCASRHGRICTMHVMGAFRRVLSSAGSRLALRVLVRVAAVIGWVVLVNFQDRGGPAPDDGNGYVAYVLLMCVVALWAVIDGIRRPFATALLAWFSPSWPCQ
jgi:hypothetical protein